MQIPARSTLAALSVLTLAACADIPTQPLMEGGHLSAAVLVNSRTPVGPMSMFNPCTGSSVTFSGTMHRMIRRTGDNHFGAKLDFQLKGQDAADRTYEGIVAQNFSFDFNANNAQQTQTEVIRILVVSHGSADDWYFELTTHLTLNADGEITAQKFEFDPLECRG